MCPDGQPRGREEPSSHAKPFRISKWVVWEAYTRVKANHGAAGVDAESVEMFEQDLKNNLYRIWNRMSSGTYFPPPVRSVGIPKKDGSERRLGVPTVADRIAQTVVKMYLEPEVEPQFHPDSYGYRPRKSAVDALTATRQRCWRYDWVIDLDVRGFFDNLDHSLALLSHGISNLGGLNLLCLLEWFCHKSFKTQEIQAVAHHNTVFGQFLALLPRHEFDAESREHQRGQRLRVMSRWAQFVALGLGQVTGRQSLRDIVANLQVQSSKLYHLGVRTVSRSSLARVNAEQPYTLYEAVFSRLLSRCQQQAPGHRFRFKHKLYAVDASTIDLCLALFPWATFRRTKAAVKLHVGLDQAGQLPSFVSLTEGKRGDVTVARTWRFPAGSVVVADRAYLDFKWLHQLQTRSVTFVTRLKRGVRYRVTHEHDFRPETGVLADQRIELTSARSGKAYPDPLRRVVYRDPQTKNRYVFVTNNTTWVAKTIADIYKSRWQIELFFKWIKQHLKVKRFIGRSKNAVWTQLWIATCMYLLLAYLKFVLRLRWSLNQMLQVLQLNIFERRPLHELFTTHAPPDPDRPQLALAWT